MTQSLHLTDDGRLLLRTDPDDGSDVDSRDLGPVEDAEYDVPVGLLDDYESLRDEWVADMAYIGEYHATVNDAYRDRLGSTERW